MDGVPQHSHLVLFDMQKLFDKNAVKAHHYQDVCAMLCVIDAC